jgi:hypothetical protein
VESLFSEKDVWSLTLSIGSKGHNILSDCGIALKFLEEFLEDVFLGVDMER